MERSSKSLESTRKYRKTKKGLVTNLYHKLKSRNHVEFDLKFLQDFAVCKKFERIFIEWKKSKYSKNKKPSIDRISLKKGYLKDNIQWLTWEENRYKQRMEIKLIRARKVGRFFNGELMTVYNSVSDAVNKLKVSQGNLSSCLNGKRKTASGFEWEYIDYKVVVKDRNLKTCRCCGREFATYNKPQKNCSRSCGSKGNKNAIKSRTGRNQTPLGI